MPIPFRQLDLNLLRVLAAIHATGSVTAAARQLALSQPAVSHALARLREHFGDVLYVRSPTGLHPTRLAGRIVPAVVAYLRALETALAEAGSFDPASDTVHWRLSMSDLGEMLFLPPLAAALRREAPQARIDNAGVPAPAVASALEARDVDLAIGILESAQRGIETETLFHERYVAVTARGWRPRGRAARSTLTARELASAPLAVASPTATYHESVQRMLDAMGLSERTVVHARHYAALPELVTRTDLLAIVPQMYARAIAARWPVRVWALWGEAPQYDVQMLWHATAEREASHVWLRSLVRRLFARRPGRTGGPRPAGAESTVRTPRRSVEQENPGEPA